MSAAWPVLTTRKKIGMNIVMNSASGCRTASRSERFPSSIVAVMPKPPLPGWATCFRDLRRSCDYLLYLSGRPVARAPGRVEEHVVEGGFLVAAAALAQVRLQLVRRPLAHDQAAVDDGEAVAELVGLLEVLRREEHRRAVAVDPAKL